MYYVILGRIARGGRGVDDLKKVAKEWSQFGEEPYIFQFGWPNFEFDTPTAYDPVFSTGFT